MTFAEAVTLYGKLFGALFLIFAPPLFFFNRSCRFEE